MPLILDEVERAVGRARKALEEARTAWDVALEKVAMPQPVHKKEGPHR